MSGETQPPPATFRRKRRTFLWAAPATVLMVFLPFPSRISPPWRIQIVDAAGVPAEGCRVAQSWKWQPLDLLFQEAVGFTDAGGWVSFPGHIKWANFQQRLFGRVSAPLSFHGNRYGPVLMLLATRQAKGKTGSPEFASVYTLDVHAPGVVERDGALTYRARLSSLSEYPGIIRRADPPPIPPRFSNGPRMLQ